MQGLETAGNKNKFVIALVTTCLDGGWRSSQIIPSTPKKTKCWLPATCAGAQLERGDDPAPKLCVSAWIATFPPKTPRANWPLWNEAAAARASRGSSPWCHTGKNKSAQLKHPGLAMAKKANHTRDGIEKNHCFHGKYSKVVTMPKKIKSFFYNPLNCGEKGGMITSFRYLKNQVTDLPM